ncbi:2Fe-2S iron-sulfur cluster-binding protein [Helicobacter sp. 11S02629-2]|uniref:2Fe-2S iron-sulfur cluster-binding protein n=1 Tax=Helicobacter sp. 11S02629-2 TaxID=1476195 RepID=UPI000BA70684|nr:2Fe-2S iron-sulfur cluster-binding protein [Helicobacter sp. 11S02629-2]PAF44920.1 hypothetical protein BKH40_04325 [Helicobacter sp. 11S02629-2]
MESFNIKIDGKNCLAFEGETILSVARRHHIYIPTLCDLPKLSPVGACRMCVVEESDGNVIASCKSLAHKDTEVKTNTKKLQDYRTEIMRFLCINHPLECGVCDRSGECELQDKVLETKVDLQPYFSHQKETDFVHFTNKIYDESLCIVCERCARTCNEFVGNSVLSVLSGGFGSKIGVDFNAYCEDCDECVSVCPTGAMISTRFLYTTNAWELSKKPTVCTQCASNCDINYEIKTTKDGIKKIYRANTNFHTSQLCHAGRHHYYDNTTSLSSNIPCLNRALSAFKNAKALRLGTTTSNEEAYVLGLLSKKLGFKLYCDEAYYYKNFLDTLQTFPVNIDESLKNAKVAIVFGSYIYDEFPNLRSNLAKCVTKNDLQTIFINPISEKRFKSVLELKYEVGHELSLALLLLQTMDFNGKYASYFESLDMGEIVAESNVSDYELARLKDICFKAFFSGLHKEHKQEASNNAVVMLVGSDIYTHKDSKTLAYILKLLKEELNVSIIPLPYNNTLGILEVCDLEKDDFKEEGVIGYRSEGNFILDDALSVLRHDFLLPNFNNLESTFINLNLELVKASPALEYIDKDGKDLLDLADIAREFLDNDKDYLVSYTELLPFNKTPYDALARRTKIELDSKPKDCNKDGLSLESLDIDLEAKEGSGSYIYHASQSGNINTLTPFSLLVSKQFCIAHGLKDKDEIVLKIKASSFDKAKKEDSLKDCTQDEALIEDSLDDTFQKEKTQSEGVCVKVQVESYLTGMVAVLNAPLVSSKKYFDFVRMSDK